MARPPRLQLTDIGLGFGRTPLFSDLSLTVHDGDRVALVGRNGSGKSTLLKVMAGLVEPDTGARVTPQGTRVGYLEQDPDLSGHATLGDFAAAGLEHGEEYRVEAAAEGLGFDPGRATGTASGGERRRAAIAGLLAQDPDVMLLDEPTNHLDIAAITWLEATLAATRAAYVLISHDRRFLTGLSRATLWVDRGQVRRQERGFADFERWREETWAAEDAARHKLNRKIADEARWAVEGISARRKRNQGRLRALQDLRAERAAQVQRSGTAAMAFEAGAQSGKRVIEARGLSHRFGDRVILRDFSLRVARGDCVAVVGPNGAGKTTLIRLLTGALAPDAGSVTLGTNLDIAVFDQNRAALDPDMSLWDTLTTEQDMRVSGQSDQVMVRGTPRHVVAYLKDFLFDEGQARGPVRALSGGERARLLLAKLMARPSNLLVLDEPTNDLDIETLDLLQDLLGQYDGTVILVSHDRDFIDRVATTTILVPGDGSATVYAGGWSDAEAQGARLSPAESTTPKAKPKNPPAQPAPQPDKAAPGPALSFTEKHRLAALPDEIARLEAEIAKLSAFLSDAAVYTDAPEKAAKATDALAQRQAALEAAETEWLTLAEKDEG